MEEISTKTLRDILTETMDLRGIDIQRLSQMTDIPERYLVAIRDSDASKLPSSPYLRGYLMKVGVVLDIDGSMLWEIYKNQNQIKKSGIEDKLPSNRFAVKSLNKKWIVLGIIIALGVVYLIWLGSDFIGVPKLDITSPVINNYVANVSSIKLAGEVSPSDKLTINGEEVLVSQSGRFEKDFPLQAGVNAIEFVVKKLLGREVKIVRNVIYQPQTSN